MNGYGNAQKDIGMVFSFKQFPIQNKDIFPEFLHPLSSAVFVIFLIPDIL